MLGRRRADRRVNPHPCAHAHNHISSREGRGKAVAHADLLRAAAAAPPSPFQPGPWASSSSSRPATATDSDVSARAAMAVLALALVLPPPPPPLVGGGGGGGPRAKRTVHQHMRHAFGVLRRPDPSKADQRPAAQPNFPRREGVGRHEAVTGLFEQLTLLPVPRLAARRDAARLTPSSVPAPLLSGMHLRLITR